MKSRITNPRRAVTLTELLVVLAIISLLATIAVPVYIQKTEQARIAVARQETKEIANAEESVFALYGYYIPIHLLDNLSNLPSGQSSSGPRDDFANDGNISSLYVVDPLANLNYQRSTGQKTLSGSSISGDVRLSRLVNSWTGPFLNAQRVANGLNDRGSMYSGGANQNEVSRALILDPWGRPYRLYSPLGVLGSASVSSIPVSTNGLFPLSLDDGQLTNTDLRFDRWAVVSFGRDGVTDTSKTGTTTNEDIRDDIFYTFGLVPGESFYRAF